jgi:hypothetical protein
MAISYKTRPAPTQAVIPPTDNKQYMKDLNVSVANDRSNDYKPTKTTGIVTRGNGAATKGITARGPMA